MGPSAALFFLAAALVARPAAADINCYQCSSTDHHEPYLCPERFNDEGDPDGYLPDPKPCSQVHGAQYCIKQTGRFEEIECVQCATPNCTELTQATSCAHVFEARYCIKTIGLYGGGVGTKRFCSALDLGNYCDYVRLPGDDMEYRSCVFTCGSNGCNPAGRTLPLTLLSVVLPAAALLLPAWRR